MSNQNTTQPKPSEKALAFTVAFITTCPKCQSSKPLNHTFCTQCMAQIISAGETRIEQKLPKGELKND